MSAAEYARCARVWWAWCVTRTRSPTLPASPACAATDATAELPFDVGHRALMRAVSPFETVGAEFGLDAMRRLTAHPRVVGVAELMSYPDVVAGHEVALAKARLGEERSLTVEGHAPGLTGAPLQAYLASGVGSDHEATRVEEGLDKLRSGAVLLVREGSVTRDLDALLPLVHESHGDRVAFVTDDRLPHDLLAEGAVDLLVRRAVAAGVNPAYVRCASLNVASHYRLPRRAPWRPATSPTSRSCPTLPRSPFHRSEGRKVVAVTATLARPCYRSDGGARRNGAQCGASRPDRKLLRLAAPGGSVRCVVLANSILTGQGGGADGGRRRRGCRPGTTCSSWPA